MLYFKNLNRKFFSTKVRGMIDLEKLKSKVKYFKRRRIANRFLVVYNTYKQKKALLGGRFYGLTKDKLDVGA